MATSFKITNHKRLLQIRTSLTSLIKNHPHAKDLTFRRSGNLQPIRKKNVGHMTSHLDLKNPNFSINTTSPNPIFLQNFIFLLFFQKK